MVAIFDTRLTNHRKAKKTNKKTAKMRFYLFWQGLLCDFRTLLLRDYDEIVRNINELSEWIENNK